MSSGLLCKHGGAAVIRRISVWSCRLRLAIARDPQRRYDLQVKIALLQGDL